MARKLNAGEFIRGDMYHVLPSEIEVDRSANGRFKNADPAKLVEEIRELGQHTPVTTIPIEDSRLKLLFGYGRYDAVSAINKHATEHLCCDGAASSMSEFARANSRFSKDGLLLLKCQIVNTEDAEQMLRLNCSENVARTGLTPMDLYSDIVRWQAFGKSNVEIGRILGISPALVTQTLKLGKLTAKEQGYVHDGTIPAVVGYSLSEDAPESRAKKIARLLAKVKGGRITMADLKGEAGLKGSKSRTAREIKEDWLSIAETQTASEAVTKHVRKIAKAAHSMMAGTMSAENLGKLLAREYEQAMEA